MGQQSGTLWVALLLSLASSGAQASVYLNGVNIDGLKGQKFESCTVVIDDNGNILITAKGVQIQTQAPAPPPVQPLPVVTAEPVTRRYFLVSEAPTPNVAQYDVDVYVNAVLVRRVLSSEAQVIVELTKHLKKGKNTIHLIAQKSVKEGRKSSDSSKTLKILIGEGKAEGPNVTLDAPSIEYVRTAAETRDTADEFLLMGR